MGGCTKHSEENYNKLIYLGEPIFISAYHDYGDDNQGNDDTQNADNQSDNSNDRQDDKTRQDNAGSQGQNDAVANNGEVPLPQNESPYPCVDCCPTCPTYNYPGWQLVPTRGAYAPSEQVVAEEFFVNINNFETAIITGALTLPPVIEQGIRNALQSGDKEKAKGIYKQYAQSNSSAAGGAMPPDDDKNKNNKQKKGKPQSNVAQNKQVNDASRAEKLTPEQRKALGKAVEKETREYGS